MEIIKKIKEVVGGKMHAKSHPLKIYIGNAKVQDNRVDITLDMTEIANCEEYFRNETTTAGDKVFLDITLLPFKNGTNKFGNNYYAIIKNR